MNAGRVHAAQGTPTVKIGITLHPYYSWTRNIVGTLPGYEIRSILPGEIDAGDYQPRPDDIKKLVDLDAIANAQRLGRNFLDQAIGQKPARLCLRETAERAYRFLRT